MRHRKPPLRQHVSHLTRPQMPAHAASDQAQSIFRQEKSELKMHWPSDCKLELGCAWRCGVLCTCNLPPSRSSPMPDISLIIGRWILSIIRCSNYKVRRVRRSCRHPTRRQSSETAGKRILSGKSICSGLSEYAGSYIPAQYRCYQSMC